MHMNNKRYQSVAPIQAQGQAQALKRQSGFSLLEVLIAVVILSVGLLGLAGMQVTSLKYVTSSLQRTQATSLAYDMLDRIRVNPNGIYTTLVTAPASDFSGTTSSHSGSNDDCLGNVVSCDAATIANFDLSEWKTAIEDLLPNGQGSVQVRPGTTEITITVDWTDKREVQGLTDADRVLSITMRTEL